MTDPVFSLHRYFIYGNRMRKHFERELERGGDSDGSGFIVSRMYMELWYAHLFTVIEGWGELKLEDVEIDRLLESDNVGLLKRLRNGVCHFQRDSFDDRFLGFINKEDTVGWVSELGDAFGRFFLEWSEV